MRIRSGGLDPQSAAKKAVSAIGLGYDVCQDIRLSGCKSRVIHPNHTSTAAELVFPGGVVVPNVSISIKCYPGESFRVSSGVLSFHEMSEQFNQELSLSGKLPSGLFNAMFGMRNCWKKDVASTKSLAFDGCFITLYSVELDRTHIILSENVKNEVPSSWNPAALAKFIEKYGTHIVIGVKMGGKDVVHMKQLRSSDLQPTEVQKLLQQVADERFPEDIDRCSNADPAEILGKLKNDRDMPWEVHVGLAAAIRPMAKSHSENEDIISISVRRGGIVGIGQHYDEWRSTISESPDVTSMLFLPITSLLNSVPGYGFVTHAVNLYLRYKPPLEELHQFLEFLLPRQWAPLHDLPLGFGPRHRKKTSPSLKFTFMGPKLYINTVQVDSGYRPVTGIRLFLEGRKSNHLAIHLLHLSNLPSIFEMSDDHSYEPIDEPADPGYFEPVKWSVFSHVCTAPVQYHSSLMDPSTAAIMSKAWFEVKRVKGKKVLFLRLGFSTVASAGIRRSEWVRPSSLYRKSGFFSALLSTMLSKELQPQVIENEKPIEENITPPVVYNNGDSGIDLPVPTKDPKMLSFVDTRVMVRGPDDTPGHWVVTGAKLCVEDGKIAIKVKYSLLFIMPRKMDFLNFSDIG